MAKCFKSDENATQFISASQPLRHWVTSVKENLSTGPIPVPVISLLILLGLNVSWGQESN